jgi:polysaccharide deacetylase family protein (PEP-CTERM system associated)
MMNAMSVDLEDWFCVYNLRGSIRREDWGRCESRVERNTHRLLELFGKHHVKATFFVLGWIAEHHPELISLIDSEGHEIGTHGYSHTMLSLLTPQSFEADLRQALRVTRSCVKEEIRGFRAPSFSLTKESFWSLGILAQHGIRYDSSVFPVGFHPDYGISGAPLSIYRIHDSILEFPMGCAEVFNLRVPCSGGGYFRMMPYAMTKALVRSCNKEGRPIVFYIHPWEIDPDQPRIDSPPMKKFRHYINLEKTYGRLDRLLTDFEFTSMRSVLQV